MNLRRDVFQAISDPTRRQILILVATGPLTAGAIAWHFDSARATVSRHLQILVECGLVRQEHVGRKIYYHFNPNEVKNVWNWLARVSKKQMT